MPTNGRDTQTPPVMANRLWLHRRKMGYTQKTVAFLLGHRTTTHLSDYERGRRLPSLATALKLEVILCAPVAFLYRGLHRELRAEVRKARQLLEAEHVAGSS